MPSMQEALFLSARAAVCLRQLQMEISEDLLAGGDIEVEVSQAAHYSPVFVYPEERGEAKDIMIRRSITALPVVDHDHRITDILFLRYPEAEEAEEAKVGVDVPVIIMAGGRD